MEDPDLAPDRVLEECQEIQLGIKDARQCPPVGIVYWPPPPDPWPKLLRIKPLKLYRFLATNEDHPDLSDFLTAVREVAR